MEISKSKNIVPNPFIVLREESDDWAILFNPETAKAVGINPVGVVIWKLINGRRKIEDATDPLLSNNYIRTDLLGPLADIRNWRKIESARLQRSPARKENE